MNTKKIIAIDPDTDKSGVAELIIPEMSMNISTLSFPHLIDYLWHVKDNFLDEGQSVTVLVEAGWLNQSNWHVGWKNNNREAAAIGNSTGRNHETGRKIIEMARHFGFPVEEIRPLRKCWTGKDGKITHEELQRYLLSQRIDFPFKRSNQEQRDAALIAAVYSDKKY